MRSDRADLLSGYHFELDRFQLDALDALDAGEHVIVAAPTGSGKTVVAEYALAAALADGRRGFYTAPIKALSNQKYRDLVEIHGDEQVGLLTGDNSINGDAPIVVMTTEVLRNMIYARRDLASLAVVVIDEVHFLQDTYRGPVWEEVIIHLDDHAQLACLSATVSNSSELGAWIETVRGPTTVVVEQRRPVELENLFMVDDRTHHTLRTYRTLIRGEPNRDMLKLDAIAARGRSTRSRKGNGRRQVATPGRLEVVDELGRKGLLPTIFFIFSRNQCSETSLAALNAGIQFTTDEEREKIRSIATERLGFLDRADLAVLDYDRFLEQLLSGVAPHHAGMVPPFKEVVEQCFIAGLTKVVFATETLAVGVNMPARSVVIDKLTKFTGEHHETLSAGQYSQLTGRAGRRGLDDKGSAVVLWSPYVRFEQVAELARSRSFHLRSAFRPTYNMASNLVRSYDRPTAHHLLSLSFGQFQADREVVKIERRLARRRDRLNELLTDAASPYGDIEEYRRSLTPPDDRRPVDDATNRAIATLHPGQLIHASKGKHHGPVAVVAAALRKNGFKLTTITPGGHLLQLTADDFDTPPVPVGDVVLPGAFSPHQRSYRDEVARRIKQATLGRGGRPRSHRSEHRVVDHPDSGSSPRHPVADDPDLRRRLAMLAEADRVRGEVDNLERQISQHRATLVRDFDAVLAILDVRGYVNVDRWSIEPAGEMLATTFHESDLLICETMLAGLLDGLSAPAMAGLVSTFVYEHRSPDDPPRPWFPDRATQSRWESIERLSIELSGLEATQDLSTHRPPDPTFFPVAYAWVAGDGFAELVTEEELTGGDFVRTIKQLVDLLGQIGQIAPNLETRHVARSAAEAARRGVIADSSAVGEL